MERECRVPRTARLLGSLVMTGLLTLTACSPPSPGQPHDAGPEPLRIAVTKAIDTVPIRIAVEQRLFEEAGVRVDLVEQRGQQEAVAALAAGAVDLAFAGNLAWLAAAADGADVQLQAEAYISGPNTMALVTLPGSTFADEAPRRDPLIGVEPGDDLGKLSARTRLTTQGLGFKGVRFTELVFDDMMVALGADRIDAALLIEPQISRAQKEYGAEIVADTAVGSMLHFPMSSYAALGAEVRERPETFARLREVLTEAQEIAADSSVVRRALSRFTALDKTTAALVAIGAFPTSLNAVRIQRVADLMLKSRFLRDRIDVESLLPPR